MKMHQPFNILSPDIHPAPEAMSLHLPAQPTTQGTKKGSPKGGHLIANPFFPAGAPPKKPPALPAHDQHTELMISDRICLDMKANACTVMEDVCKLAGKDESSGLCTKLTNACAQRTSTSPQVTLDAKICVNFEISTPACHMLEKVCATGSDAAQGALCKKLLPLCST